MCAHLLMAAGATRAQESAEATAQTSTSKGSSYEVWADVLFGPDGRNLAFHLPDEADLPTAFADLVKRQLQSARIPSVQDSDGSPATFRTGVRMDYRLLPASNPEENSQVQFLGLAVAPLPVKRYLASYPKDVSHQPGWEGGVKATCHVSPEGLCQKIDVQMLPGMPESVRRFAKASFDGWVFEAQRINNRPVEGEVSARFALHTRDEYPRDFRIPAFQRFIQGR
jgi:hypothetical protein